ncbi:MAG: PASTA domain-containing protein [Acidobacteriota bacterium]
MWRKLVRGLGCLGYLAALGVVFAFVAYAAFSLFVRGGVTSVPDLKGLAEEESTALLADQGLRAVRSEDTRFDEQVPKGHVLIQEPRAGVYVKRNAEIQLTFSRGPRRIEVPEVLGQAVQAAQVSLSAAGLATGRTFEVWTTEGLGGTVVSQHPAAGARVEVDAPVDLFVAADNTAEIFVMPDLIQRDYDDVKSFFEARGVRIGRVSYETYAGVPPGTVLRQFPRAGHPLRQTDVISLGVVAEPEPPAPEPSASESTAPEEPSATSQAL